MCGICAVFQSESNISHTIVTDMTQALAHRGPDAQRVVIIQSDRPAADQDEAGYIGLGHTRLAVLDLSPAGHQPMQRRENGPTIVFNGEIYNYRELRDMLKADGYAFNSDSDTEVILAAYDAWHHEMVHRLNGMFALAVWDSARRELLVARDRLGIKPLYYFEKDGNFACASELKSLLKYPHFEPEINTRALYQYLVRGFIPTPETIFEHVHKLLPGHLLVVRGGKVEQIEQYWNPLPFFEATCSISECEALEELDALLQRAVRYRLVSDVPLGALLSGGIDSSLIVALMQEQSTQPVKTFTIAFDTPKYNEAPFAKAIAKYLGTEHHELTVNEASLLEFVPNLVHFFDEPFADMSAIPTYAVSALARQYVTVALSGDGGDETHLGYSTYAWMQKREQIRRRLPEPLIDVSRFLTQKVRSRQIQRLGQYWPQPEAQELLNSHASHMLDQTSYERTMERLQRTELIQRMSAADLTSYMVDDILTKVDRASMAVALETRVPLLDHNLVEYAAGLPLHLKKQNGTSKYLLRKLLHKRVPAELTDRPKHGFTVPMSQWLRGSLRELLCSMTTRDSLDKHGLFQADVVTQHVREHLAETHDHSKKLWSLLVFQMWYEYYMQSA
jgi:asparagine synthase (glutamine-hydrolysing)